MSAASTMRGRVEELRTHALVAAPYRLAHCMGRCGARCAGFTPATPEGRA